MTMTLAQAGGTAVEDAPPPAPGVSGTANPQTATTAAPPTGLGPPQTQPSGGGAFNFSSMLLPLAMIAVFWFIIFAPQRKEKKRRAAMLAALKKGDKVSTIGGEIGTVVEVNDQNVLLKVDESSNTRIRYVRSAIQGVIEEKTPVETGEKK
jgi:preprotein translocase subunit YajC